MSSSKKNEGRLDRLLAWSRSAKSKNSARPSFAVSAQQALDENVIGSKKVVAHDSLRRTNVSVAELKPGECGHVDHLKGSAQGRLRLLEMGLTPGTHVKVIRAAAFGGPLDIQVRGYQLSLRREEAAAIWLGEQDELK